MAETVNLDVTTLEETVSVTTTDGGTVEVAVQAEKGDAATVTVGTTTTGNAGTNASVTNSGTTSAAVFNFTIPRGDTGAAGPNTVTSATTSDGTATLSTSTLTTGTLTVSTSGVFNATSYTFGTGAASAMKTALAITSADITDATALATNGTIAKRGANGEIAFGNSAATGTRAHAHGSTTLASGNSSHSEGASTIASGTAAHAEGLSCVASGFYSHAEGSTTTASGIASHSEGDTTTASGDSSHAEGYLSVASGDFSHAAGFRAKAIHLGARVMSDSQNADVSSTTTDQMTCRFQNGYSFLGGAAVFVGAITASNYNPGANVSTALSTAVGSAGAFVVNGGALGTPSSGTLTSCTGLPISTGVSGLGANVATFLATPSSANLAAAVTDETGTGSLVFAQNSTLSGTTLTSLERNTLGRIAALTMSQSPPCSLFEDFCGASGAGVFTWTSSGTGSDSVGAIGQNSFGVRRMTTGTTSGNQRRAILAIPSSTIFGTEIRAHFAIPDVTTCDAFIGMEQISGAFGRYLLLYSAALNSGRWILVTGTGAGVFTNFGTNGPANGNFASGKRYRSIMRPINATTVYVKIDEADWNADNWSVMHDANVTISSYTPSADPMALDIRVNTQTNAARSLDIDYISVENTSIVR